MYHFYIYSFNLIFPCFQFSIFQAREAKSRSAFLISESDRWTKDSASLSKLLSEVALETKLSNEVVSTDFESEARTWMDGLKGRIERGREVFFNE